MSERNHLELLVEPDPTALADTSPVLRVFVSLSKESFVFVFARLIVFPRNTR